MSFASAREMERWLAAEHARSPGIWLKIPKKGSGVASVSYADAIESALCFGWIDGQRAPAQEGFFLQRFTRRSSRSRWSKINRQRAEALIASGRMDVAGLREVERARTDGRWDAAYDGARTAQVPEDLQAALDANPKAAAFFATLDGSNRYSVLYRLQEAKRPETRARRLDTFVAMLANGQKLHP
jgi:uncharacterized protein YdeI (YjbR/CyaY-like superfamily)